MKRKKVYLYFCVVLPLSKDIHQEQKNIKKNYESKPGKLYFCDSLTCRHMQRSRLVDNVYYPFLSYLLSSQKIKQMPSQQTFVLMKTSWRRLEDVFCLHLQKTSLRRLQDALIKTDILAWDIRLQKTSSRRLQDALTKTNIFVLAIRFQDVLKTSSKKLLKDIFKTPSKHL